jgi:hypothetical protein
MTIIATTCRRCGTEFEPSREAIVAGAWRLCPACRDVGPPGLADQAALRESGARERR